MTPQEKAEQIVFDMGQRIEQACNQSSRQAHNSAAIQCAILAVAEIVSALDEYDNRNGTNELQNMDRDFDYWEKVQSALNSR